MSHTKHQAKDKEPLSVEDFEKEAQRQEAEQKADLSSRGERTEDPHAQHLATGKVNPGEYLEAKTDDLSTDLHAKRQDVERDANANTPGARITVPKAKGPAKANTRHGAPPDAPPKRTLGKLYRAVEFGEQAYEEDAGVVTEGRQIGLYHSRSHAMKAIRNFQKGTHARAFIEQIDVEEVKDEELG